MKPLHVLIDTSPLNTGHAHRGIGVYTAQLLEELRHLPELMLSTSPSEARGHKLPVDVIHYPYFDLFFHTLPLVQWGAPSVVTIHDVIPLEFPEQYRSGKRGMAALWLQRLALSSVSAVITDSIYSKNQIAQKLQYPKDSISVVYLAANPELAPAEPAKVRSTLERFSITQPYMLYVGDINYNKNLPQLIKSLKYLPDEFQLVLAGKNFKEQDIPEWRWITTQAAASDVERIIRYIPDLGKQADRTLSALYTGATAYVQPSLSEGFGLPVLEAMRAHTVVVCTGAGSLPEVGGRSAFYCEPHAESIAEAVRTVAEMPQSKRTAWIKEAAAHEQRFSWKTTAQETARIYHAAAGV
jgi:glycosyltransferase involved in cell wall biosynthesis